MNFRHSTLSHFRKYFPHSPPSYIVAFVLLHEVTAIVPLPFIYAAIGRNPSIQLYLESKLPQDVIDCYKENATVSYFSRMNVDLTKLALTYAVIKAVMPVRIAACVLLTPAVGRFVIAPMSKYFRIKIFRSLNNKVDWNCVCLMRAVTSCGYTRLCNHEMHERCKPRRFRPFGLLRKYWKMQRCVVEANGISLHTVTYQVLFLLNIWNVLPCSHWRCLLLSR